MKKLEKAFEVAEHTDAMLAFWDKDLVCRFANSSYFKWFGISPLDMIDKITLPQLLGPLYLQNRHYINQALEGKVQVFEREIPLPNGEIRNTLATYTPEIKEGDTKGFYAHVADISALKNPFIQKKVMLEDYLKMTISHNYLNGIEHELRACLFTFFPGILTLANQFSVSATKLKRDFKIKYNQTIFSYYRSLQMQVAEKYITQKVYSKKQLAEMFHFESTTNFSVCYKKFIVKKEMAVSSNNVYSGFKKNYTVQELLGSYKTKVHPLEY